MELQIAHLGKVSVTPEGEHSNLRKYKKNSLVTVSDSEHVATFISVKFVPIGVSILNTTYWMRLGWDPAVELPEVPTIRTINNEQLTNSSLGDINLFDGFYFPNAVQDYDGNWYGAVVVGDQVWLAENLKSTHYANGDEITMSSSDSSNTPLAWYPNNNQNNVDNYGLLYNWYAVTKGERHTEANVVGISPGTQQNNDNIWHIPSEYEFGVLANYIKNQHRYKNLVGVGLAYQSFWTDTLINPNGVNNNHTGFSLVPAGFQHTQGTSSLAREFGDAAYLYSSTYNGNLPSCFFLNGRHWTGNWNTTTFGVDYIKMSVRCISDLNPIQFRNWYIQQYGSLNHVVGKKSINYDTTIIDEVISSDTELSFDYNTRTSKVIEVDDDVALKLNINNDSDNVVYIKNNTENDLTITVTGVKYNNTTISDIYKPLDTIVAKKNHIVKLTVLANSQFATISSELLKI